MGLIITKCYQPSSEEGIADVRIEIYRELIDSDQIIGQSLIHVVKEYRYALAQKKRLSDERMQAAKASMLAEYNAQTEAMKDTDAPNKVPAGPSVREHLFPSVRDAQ